VSFLVRPGCAAQLERDGLVVQTRGEERRQPVRTLLAGQIDRPFDIIVLTCKAYDLPSAMEAIAPAVGPASAVVPLLNGLSHLDALDARFGAARVLGGVAYIATVLGEDGVVRHISPTDTILFGDRSGRLTPPVEALAGAFAATPVTARASTDILQEVLSGLAPDTSLASLERGW
jgi:2-dehydropantoate 2-reductase